MFIVHERDVLTVDGFTGELEHAITHAKVRLLVASSLTIDVAKQAASASKLSRKVCVFKLSHSGGMSLISHRSDN